MAKSSDNPLVSIIIPLHWGLKPENFPRFLTDLKKYDKLKYQHYEILVVTDKPIVPVITGKKVRCLVMNINHPTTGTEKRDFALPFVKGEICAFIDDDAYPDSNWLTNAIPWFKYERIVAVGGPGVTPLEDSFWQKIGGYAIESYFCSGNIQYRFYPTFERFSKDQPGYNLLVRTSVLKKVKGWGTTFYGGEDTVLCIKLLKFGKILHDPNIIVYHHRRTFPFGHLKQIGSVGLHRGYFFKKYPQTSRGTFYLLPTILTLGFISGIVLVVRFPQLFALPFVLVFLFFLLLGTISVYRHKVDITSSLIASIAIMMTHMSYGVFFVKGLLTHHLNK
ncbi:MAG: hypothetical protein A3B53_02285 [Candidatus Levybacteria bacterium RIFCSPLOWO2_01_FULL_42_15]|nr:MAG: hypothetical protein A3B53_02285 [Candidatus Levybacteria bacterium RIFCSPLOWO2_01_FULL_42_15]